MKAILLCLATVVVLTGCESDLPPNPNQPSVSIGNNKFREDGNERPAQPATDREKNVW
jgi:hypothetical protein